MNRCDNSLPLVSESSCVCLYRQLLSCLPECPNPMFWMCVELLCIYIYVCVCMRVLSKLCPVERLSIYLFEGNSVRQSGPNESNSNTSSSSSSSSSTKSKRLYHYCSLLDIRCVHWTLIQAETVFAFSTISPWFGLVSIAFYLHNTN